MTAFRDDPNLELNRTVKYLDVRIDTLEKSLETRFSDFKEEMSNLFDFKFAEAIRDTDSSFSQSKIDIDKHFAEVHRQFAEIKVQLAKFENLETRITLKLGGLIIGAMTFIEVFQKYWS